MGSHLPVDRLDRRLGRRAALTGVVVVVDQGRGLPLVRAPALGQGRQSGMGLIGRLKACGLQMKELFFDRLLCALLGFADCGLGALKGGLRIHDQPALSHAVVTQLSTLIAGRGINTRPRGPLERLPDDLRDQLERMGNAWDVLPGMNAGASSYAVPSPIEGSGTAWVLLGSWALSPARPTPIHPRHECRGFSALLGECNDFGARGNRPAPSHLARAAFAPIAPPLDPQPVEMADTYRNRGLSLGNVCEQHTARTRRVLVEPLPQQGCFNFAKLSPSITGETYRLSEGTLAWGEGHDGILLESCFRMKSAPSPL